jgi:hypothetical protein
LENRLIEKTRGFLVRIGNNPYDSTRTARELLVSDEYGTTKRCLNEKNGWHVRIKTTSVGFHSNNVSKFEMRSLLFRFFNGFNRAV